jgi:N-methylhydantoinase A/oxoprolinase/acetone carboxylase beta subunit
MFVACIDIGGTFTDLVLHSPDTGLEIFKSPTTPGEFERGFLDVLRLAGESHGLSLATFLGQVELIVHGTTVSTNALVEGKVAPVGLLCNAGHPDILTLREAPRKRAFHVKIDYPPPFVPRNRTCEVRGRIDAMGNEVHGQRGDSPERAGRHRCRRPSAAMWHRGRRRQSAMVDRESGARAARARDPGAGDAGHSRNLEP